MWRLDYDEFGHFSHLEAGYKFASNHFDKILHYDYNNVPIIEPKIIKFQNFMNTIHSQETSLIQYIEDGGDLLDCYHYILSYGGDGSISIPKIIICYGLTKLVREMIHINPEYINLIRVNGSSLLSLAVRRIQYEIIDLLLIHGADPNIACKKKRETALLNAIYIGNPEIVKKLLDNGANIECSNCLYGGNYLDSALSKYTYYSQPRFITITNRDKLKIVIKLLIKYGSVIQYYTYDNKIKQEYEKIMYEVNESGEY